LNQRVKELTQSTSQGVPMTFYKTRPIASNG
jgi:hypothetical protein